MLIDHDTSGRNDKPTGTEFADDKSPDSSESKGPVTAPYGNHMPTNDRSFDFFVLMVLNHPEDFLMHRDVISRS